jgi:tetratricopeptide (TPR) repeat protein
MSGIYDDSNRQVMPRWYPFRTACSMGDLEPAKVLTTPKIQSPEAYETKINDWREKKTIPRAVDLVGTAIILGDFENRDVRTATDYILSSEKPISSFARDIAEIFKGGGKRSSDLVPPPDNYVEHRHQQIARLKSLVRMYPRNAISWTDLSYYYTLLGEKQKAEHSMNVALSIARENRFILRSAARFFLHINKPDESLFYLRHSGSSTDDPWIVSAEIAISAGIEQPPKFVKRARSMVFGSNLSPWSLNELAAALSTLEARDGYARKSKSLLRRALQDPDENTIAQAVWLTSAHSWEFVRPQKEIVAPFEANARSYFRDADYKQAFLCTKEWGRFQPFTSRPAVLASYIASVCLRDDHEAISVIDSARKSSVESPILANNYAFSLASLGNIQEAENVLSNIRDAQLDDRERDTILATKGLIEFRKGNTNEGRRLYEEAVASFRKKGNFHSMAIAVMFRAREEILIHSEFSANALKEATTLAEKHGVKEIFDYATFLASQIKTQGRPQGRC